MDCPVSWSGRIRALMARCDLEKSDRRAVDRSMRQLDVIISILIDNRFILISVDTYFKINLLFFVSRQFLQVFPEISLAPLMLSTDNICFLEVGTH